MYLILSITFSLIFFLCSFCTFLLACIIRTLFFSSTTQLIHGNKNFTTIIVIVCRFVYVFALSSKVKLSKSRETSWANGTWMFVYIYLVVVVFFVFLASQQCTSISKGKRDNVCCYVIALQCNAFVAAILSHFPFFFFFRVRENRFEELNWY